MTEVARQESWWSSSSWFAGGVLQDAPAAPAAQPVASQPAVPGDARPAQQQDGAGLLLVGGARAQSRFSGRTAIPIATCTPLSSAGNAAVQAPAAAAATAAAAPTAAAPHPSMRSGQEQPQAAPLPALGRHAAWAGRPAGHTIDGSTPTRSSSACGEHTSRWVFDTASWQWRVRDGQPCAAAASPSDKHQLAARRWGDSRDGLGAAALGRQQAEQQAASKANDSSSAAAATARPAAPAKRQRLHVGAMTGDTSDAGWAAVGGLQRQKEALMEAVSWPLAHPRLFARLGAGGARGVLLHGPPGSGKTHLVRALAAEAQLGIVVLNGGECAGQDAEKRLRSAFNQAKSQAPCILLLDELDALAPSRAASTSEHERQATARLLAAMDELRASRARVALVGATNRREAVDAALRRAGRLDCEVALGALRPEERAEVLRCCTARMPLAPDVQLDAFAARLRGFVAADVAAVAAEAALLCAAEAVRALEAEGRHVPSALEQPEFLASLRVSAAHFEAAVVRLGPSVLRGLAPEVPAVRWDDIGGLQEAKAALRELVELPLAHGHLLDAYGLPPPRGALLYGPPGCGKTLLAKAAANECGANFLSIRGPELLSKWLGESEAAVRRVFNAARQAAPCLLFFDEFDSVGGRRSASSSGGGDAAAARVLNQLLVEMDGLTGVTGAACLCWRPPTAPKRWTPP
ncbi:hypothetical protein COHA_001279 [Chlorella ohadii]|uniref:AAA+ ATPase domain-containing protein n=1 Tax=Chlorella ohadii TaxID=2649997 RepID=A0AAD5DZN6_9CHLO|nr:hypothetical protein COHA_001279 [Chlorella ohadii]